MTKIDIKGDVVSNTYGQFYDYWGMDSVYPKKIQDAIEADEDGEIDLHIASNGGDVFAASEIYTMLKSSGKKVTVDIQGLAASAASVIAMAGDVVRISPTAQIMIHKAQVEAYGNSDDFEDQARILSSVDNSIVNAYAMKTGKKSSEILQLMAVETWLSAQDAVSQGFADEILFMDDEDDGISDVYTNALHSLPPKSAINKFLNMRLTENLKNEQKAEPKPMTLREQKLAILNEN